jgi:outer membrane protein OmpA-like peptidoglycan-associated protein
MDNRLKIGLALSLSALMTGCSNQEIKAPQILCPIVGAVTGAGIVAAASDSDDEAAYIAGAAVGGALGYFFCREKEVPPAPAVAAAPAPRPAPPPPPPPPAAPAPGTTLVSLEGTNFDFNKSTLRPEAIAKLDNAAQVMSDNAGIKVNVEGHTDSVGSDSYNQNLSERRANAVVDYLVGKGIDATRLAPAGYGEGRPVATNDTAEGRAQNRRVDLIVAE